MATYKVIQDIEAEDKLLGPFSLRQFIYLMIVAVSGFIGYRLFLVQPFLVVLLLPHTIFFALLAAPLGKEQSSEVWILAKIRFIVKPRKRVWDQTGAQNLVTITAPKKIERQLTKDLSQTEVRSRLQALANTIDSRGWAIKNVNVNLFAQPAYATGGGDRLVAAGTLQPTGPTSDVTAQEDMLDERNNPTAQSLDRMISASSQNHREKVVAQMKQATTPQAPKTPLNVNDPNFVPADYWFLSPNGGQTILPQPAAPAAPPKPSPLRDVPVPAIPMPAPTGVVSPDPTAVAAKDDTPPPAWPLQPGPLTEDELLDKIHKDKEKHPKHFGHMRVIKTLEEQKADEAAAAAKKAEEAHKAVETAVTKKPDPAIVELANNDDLNVATIARQANKAKDKKGPSDGEVVINLH